VPASRWTGSRLTGSRLTGFPLIGRRRRVHPDQVPEQHVHQTLANCAVTIVLAPGRLTVQGTLSFQAKQPEPAVLAVTGGTGRFDGAAGSVAVSFKDFKILTIKLK
jgi:Allene oxide cyclase barrel like domain